MNMNDIKEADKQSQSKSAANIETTQSNNAVSVTPPPYGNELSSDDENGVLKKMESFFNADFSNVTIHKNSTQATELGADAFTQGNDIHFAIGKYNPTSNEGKELIGHELTHVVQQRKGVVKPNKQHNDYQVNDDTGLEAEADAMGKKAAHSTSQNTNNKPSSISSPSSTIQRKANANHSSTSSEVTQFRLPTFNSLNDTATNTDLNIPKDVLKNRVRLLIYRLHGEGRLNTTDNVDEIMGRLFDSSDNLVQAEYNNIVDETDRSQVYNNPLDRHAEVQANHLPRFRQAMARAASLCSVSASMDVSLRRIFGTKTAKAKVIYSRAAELITRLKNDDAWMQRITSVDYNLDDPEVLLAGSAHHDDDEENMRLHFSSDIVMVNDFRSSVATIIHEACHLADDNVIDRGYYPGNNRITKEIWASLSEDQKITNAAHFEEFPRRYNSFSVYERDRVFIPNNTGGSTPTEENTVRREIREYYRQAWNSALNIKERLSNYMALSQLGDNSYIVDNREKLINVSRLANLTIHEQEAGNETITNLDVTLFESAIRMFKNQSMIAEGRNYSNLIVPGDLEATKSAVLNETILINPAFNLAHDRDYLEQLQTKTSLHDFV